MTMAQLRYLSCFRARRLARPLVTRRTYLSIILAALSILSKRRSRVPTIKSCPEDFFDPALLATKIDGKTFNPEKEHDAPGEFGKVVFAERIVRPQAGTIGFSGFDPLLTRIDAVLEDYAKRTAQAQRRRHRPRPQRYWYRQRRSARRQPPKWPRPNAGPASQSIELGRNRAGAVRPVA